MGEREGREEGGRESYTLDGFVLHVPCICSLCTEPALSLLTLALLNEHAGSLWAPDNRLLRHSQTHPTNHNPTANRPEDFCSIGNLAKLN